MRLAFVSLSGVGASYRVSSGRDIVGKMDRLCDGEMAQSL